MPTQKVTTTIDRFGGLSDRAVPIKATRIESPDLLNVDFHERVVQCRGGYDRLHDNRFGDAALRLMPRYTSGTFDAPYGRIPNRSFMNPASAIDLAWFISVSVVMAQRPAGSTAVTVLSKGWGGAGAANQHWWLGYDPTLNTNQGGWYFSYQGGSLSMNLSVNDGDGLNAPVGEYRYIEIGWSGPTSNTITMRVLRSDGTSVGSATSAAWSDGLYIGAGSLEDITIGVGMSASNTLASNYFNGTVAELRYLVGLNGTHDIARTDYETYGHEIADYKVDSAFFPFSGYYRLNDADASGVLNDLSANENHGSLPFSPPTWAVDPDEVIGPAGLEWRPNQAAYVQLDQLTNGSASIANIFAGASGVSGNRWTVRGICVPKLPPGATQCPRGVVLWAGTHATNPAPVAFGINLSGTDADKFQAIYNDGGTLRTLTISSPLASALDGVRVRWAVSRQSFAGLAQGKVVLQLCYETPGGPVNGFYTPAATFTLTGATAGTTSATWTIGRHLTGGGVQTNGSIGILSSDGSFCGVIDDVQLVWAGLSTSAAAVGIGWTATNSIAKVFEEVFDWSSLNSMHQTVFYLKFNDGHGNTPLVLSQGNASWRCAMYPMQHDGYRWDAGIVEPYNIVRVRGLWDYKRFRADGTTERKYLAVAGSGLYSIPAGGGTAQLVGAGIFQSDGLVSFSQYGSNVILAEPNGQRPMIYDGGTLRFAGIVAPTVAPSATTGTGSGGTLGTGTYYLYYTFVNALTGDESNPSPGFAVTYGSGTTNNITSVIVPTSPDPQVNTRRVYLSSLGGTEGSVAYLVATINDNTTVSYTGTGVAITTLDTTTTTLEYFLNQEAPQAGIVGVFRDAAFVGGNSVFPTRLYRSAIGSLTRFDHDAYYLDLDLDSGDPIKNMTRTNNYLLVSIQDGTARVFNTGDTNAPFAFDFLPIRHGAVGAQASAQGESTVFYMSDNDCFKSDGQNEINISSPDNPLFPSIQNTIIRLNPSRRGNVSVAAYHPNGQVWFACALDTATVNDTVLVYDDAQGIWSKYDLPCECLLQAEDENDSSVMLGSINGYVCVLDSGTIDGPSSFLTTIGSSGGAAGQLETVDAADCNHGAIAYVYRFATNDIVKIVLSVTADSTTVYYYDDGGGETFALGDLIVSGRIPWFIDFLLDWGNPIRKKKTRWITVAGSSTADGTFLRCDSFQDVPSRDFDYDTALGAKSHAEWKARDAYKLLMTGGACRSMRVRLSETSDVRAKAATPFPSSTGQIQIYQIEGTADLLDIP